jgi:hypothetical protein
MTRRHFVCSTLSITQTSPGGCAPNPTGGGNSTDSLRPGIHRAVGEAATVPGFQRQGAGGVCGETRDQLDACGGRLSDPCPPSRPVAADAFCPLGREHDALLDLSW